MVLLRFLLLMLISFCMFSCRTYEASDFYNDEEINEQIDLSAKESLRLEKQAKSHSLLAKAAHFEKAILGRMHADYKLAARSYTSKPATYIRTDMTAQFLSAMAYKYSVLKQEEDRLLIHQIIDTYLAVDKANGFDGFIPYKVAFEGEEIKIVSNETHENVYVQLFHAYFLVHHPYFEAVFHQIHR